MINRQNWLDVRDYLTHLDRRLGRDPQTIHKYWGYLRHLIEWADETPLPASHRLDPVLPLYLMSARNDGKSTPLSHTTQYKALTTIRLFYQFARTTWATRYQKILPDWVETLVPRSKPEPTLDEHRFYTLDEAKTIAAVSAETLREKRGQVAVCMLFLSGMRPDALASIPLQCVDLPNRRLLQYPSMGIRTKNDKAAITYLLDIPELFSIVQEWDARVRQMAPTSLWYAPIARDGIRLVETSRAIFGRASAIGEDIRVICDRAGVEYKSPHKLRHGHIVYARGFARNMEEVKAISQNVMHANAIITDQVYSALTTNQVQHVIRKLGSSPEMNKEELLRLIELLKVQLK